MKSKQQKLPSDAEFVTLDEASFILGKGFSKRNIRRRIDAGDWKEGIHWVDDRRSSSTRRLIKINLTAVREWRRIPAAYR